MKLRKIIPLAIISMILSACVKPANQRNTNNSNETPVLNGNILFYFKFEASINKTLDEDISLEIYKNNQVSAYLRKEADVSSLIATFDCGDGKLYVDDKEQISGKTPNNFTVPVSYKLITPDNKIKEYTVSLVKYTGLPVILITTENLHNVTDRETWLKAHIKIDGLGKFDNTDAECFVKGRGNGSWKFPKKPFNLKLTERGHILGMKKHKRWSFLANYRDKTLLRNAAVFQMGYAAEALEWTPYGEFAEIIFNGQHIGNFYVCEQVRVDKNRINIDEMSVTDIQGETVTGGYLLELDEYFDEINKFRTPINNWPVNIKNPDEDILTSQQLEYITNYIIKVEQLMEDGSFEDLYNNYIDLDSFVDYWLVQALAGNTEMKSPHSVFCYKKRSGKLYAGPIWDFDLSTFTQNFTGSHAKSIWYKYLLEDPIFKARLKKRFVQFNLRTESSIPNYIDSQESYLSTSATINFNLWPIDIEKLWGRVNGDEEKSYSEAIGLIQEMYTYRMEWLRNYINKL